MRALVVIAASGNDGDLVELAVRSLRPWGFRATSWVIGGPHPHGFKLDMAKGSLGNADVVVTLDSDCVVFPGWLEWIERTLADPLISACGAPRIDGAPGLHPSMLAMRADLYRTAPSFLPTVDGRDTGVAVSEWLAEQGYLQGARESRGTIPGRDWWAYHLAPVTSSERQGVPFEGQGPTHVCPDCRAPWHEECGTCAADWDHACRLQPLWWHLGSGTASAWPGIPRYLYRHVRGLFNADYRERAGMWAKRRTFIRDAGERLGH